MKPVCLANRRCSKDDSPALALRWLWDESGQDVIEYALLAAIVGIASILTWDLLVTTVRDVYIAADSDVQGISACTPDPGGGGC
jgi:Flp pilus assembly pilin Flp